MRGRWLLLLIVLSSCAVANPRLAPQFKDDSNTANPLPAAGANFVSQTQTFLSTEDANRFYEQGFLNNVSTTANTSACLGATGAGLTMTPTACVAYNAGFRSIETGALSFPNASTCWVAMDENTSGANSNIPNFTRAGATHYLIDCVDITQPAMGPDTQLLMKVVTSGGSITAVTDLRNKQVITLSSLFPPTANLPMGGFTLTGLPAAAASGQPLVGGLNNTVTGTQLASLKTTGNGAIFDNTVLRPNLSGVSIAGRIDATAYGAAGDMVSASDGVTNATTTFSSASRNCVAGDAGKVLVVNGATGFPAGTTIASCAGNNYVASSAASGSASGLTWYLGTNNAAALLAAAQAACPSPGPTCRSALYLPGGYTNAAGITMTGRYLVSYTGSQSALVWNPSTLGNGAQVFVGGFHLVGDGGRENAQGGGPGATEIVIAANTAKLGIDMFGTAYVVFENVDIEEPVGATGPTYLLGGGKTTSCDCDVVSLMNSSFQTYAGQNTAGIFAYGWENFWRANTDIKAQGGGHAMVWSGANALNGGITASGVTLRTPPVSNTEYNETGENGNFVIGSSGKPAACLYLDGNAINIHRNGYFCNMYGIGDYDIWDGNTGAVAGTNYEFNINGRVEDNFAGANTQRAISLGAKLDNSTVQIQFVTGTSAPTVNIVQLYTALTDSLVHISTGFTGFCFSAPTVLSSIVTATAGCTKSITTNYGLIGDDSSAMSGSLQGLSMVNGGTFSLASSAFAGLPACSTSNELWCSDCKDVAAGVTMASTCVAGGSGSVAVCKGGTWKCGQ